ncbi:class I SAM-dependent methyltransferase [Bacterioplanoides sp.]|uniref:class I SAM-dependent methyltransferase n=1 Tax=Bacterioplanoides sp. TaxID=2066072 RepID=UPI003AFFB44C
MKLIHLLAAALLISGNSQAQDSGTNLVQKPLNIGDQSHRSEQQRQRDQFRHPAETLAFFEIKPSDTVVEIWPGGGWYSQILAPLLKDNGQLIAAHWPTDSKVGYFRRLRSEFESNFLSKPEQYGNIQITHLEPPKHLKMAEDSSADKVLTFRNVHNWMRNQQEQAVFNAAFKALKSGGILGVVEHRAPDSFSYDKMVQSGYVSEAYVKELAKKAGFELLASSEVNANAKDTKNHPKGVWTLPPSLRLGDVDKEKYLAIGESDRMTLKFIKP